MTTAYSYDSVGNLLTQATSGASEIAFSYAYNKNGYITGEVRKENGTTTESTYAYDALGQLTSFLQSTGYGEQYTYDKAGNMTEKVLTGTDGVVTALKMSYNKANQLTTMVNGRDKITYKYDKNGSMVEKALSSKAYGKLTDSYTYNALDQLTSYTGYDGYRQQFTYDANGMRLNKREAGDANRSTLEELLRGNIAGLPEIVEPVQSQTNADESDMPAELEWATTEYLYDLTQEYYQVISETTTNANGTSATTAYAYGLERIAAYTEDRKTSYVYDGRGSVAQTVTVPVAGEAASSALPDVSIKVQSFSYTAFGEQMGAQKASGFTYNAEAYDAATGMLNLRARQYEPALNRFSQKDIVRGQITSPLSLNRYAYCVSSPVMHTDPRGESVLDSFGNWWGKAKQTTVGKAVDALIVKPVTSAVKKIAKVVKPIVNALIPSVEQAYQVVQKELREVDPSRPTCEIEKELIRQRACSRLLGNEEAVNEITKQLEKIQGYDKADWLFLTGDCILDESISLEDRFAMLDILKEKQDITAEDLIELGLYTEETRYHPFFFGLFKEDVAGTFAALLELSYRLTRQETTVWEMGIEEQRMRSQQQFSLLYYLGIQAGLSYVQAYNAAGSAIRMDGASVAASGFESILSDFEPFPLSEAKLQQQSYMTGKAGEPALASLVGGSCQKYFKTSLGGRFVDQFSGGVAHESKVGYTTLTQRIRLQILKDAELIQMGRINGAVWHFFTSGVTGLGGASQPLLDFLTENGISYIIH